MCQRRSAAASAAADVRGSLPSQAVPCMKLRLLSPGSSPQAKPRHAPSCLRMCLIRPPLALAKCSGTVPFLLLRPPYFILRAPTPRFCRKYTLRAMEAAHAIHKVKLASEDTGAWPPAAAVLRSPALV